MNIPEKAVEAVLRRGHSSWPDGYDEGQQAVIRAAARKDLEAAAGAMYAQALRDAATRWEKLDAQGRAPMSAPRFLHCFADEREKL